MKKLFTLAGCLGIVACLSFSSCVSTGKQLSQTPPPDNNSRVNLITMRNDSAGVVYITVDGKMLFQPGSTLVDPRAKRALEPLGKLLYRGDENFSIVIKGSAESDEMVQARFVDDWSLSQARANTIMRILTQSAALEQKAEARKAKSPVEPVEVEEVNIEQQTNGKQYVLVLISSL